VLYRGIATYALLDLLSTCFTQPTYKDSAYLTRNPSNMPIFVDNDPKPHDDQPTSLAGIAAQFDTDAGNEDSPLTGHFQEQEGKEEREEWDKRQLTAAVKEALKKSEKSKK
jgi:hypothetical protein